MRPFSIQVDSQDNVAIVANEGGLPAGSQFDSGLTLLEAVPEAHKVALADIAPGAPVVRYGALIGYATSPIEKGRWVHEGVMSLPAAPALDQLPLSTAVPDALPPLEGYSFEGFLNDDGSVGTKNLLGIATTVQCVSATVEFAVRRIRAEILPRYPNVDDVIAITHPYGCGVAINAPGSDIPIRTLRNLSLNPNLGGAPMVVSLGCEKLQPARPASRLRAA
jgi:galactarate dehydratase